VQAGGAAVSADSAVELVVYADAAGGEWGVSDGAGTGTAGGAEGFAFGIRETSNNQHRTPNIERGLATRRHKRHKGGTEQAGMPAVRPARRGRYVS